MGFPGGSDSKESACSTGDLSSIPGQEDPLEKGVAAHSNIPAWEIPWTEEPWNSIWGSVLKYNGELYSRTEVISMGRDDSGCRKLLEGNAGLCTSLQGSLCWTSRRWKWFKAGVAVETGERVV